MPDNQDRAPAEGYGGAVSFSSYGWLGATSQPANAVADLIASNDQYHDNVLTLENTSARAGTKISELDGKDGVISNGRGYTDGVFLRIPLTTMGAGKNARANFVVVDGAVKRCEIVDGGENFNIGDQIGVENPALGGGSGFSSVVKALTGWRGNAATRYRDPITGYERCAFGYNGINNQAFFLANPLLYAEIGNIGPPGNTWDTDFAIVNTHNQSQNNFPGTAYIVFRVRGDTGQVEIANHRGTSWVTFSDSQVARIVGTLAIAPGRSVVPPNNGDVVMELTDDTTLTFRARGSDGRVRSGSLTLS
jgi:hypothetical protein